jgi:hypothetical protein
MRIVSMFGSDQFVGKGVRPVYLLVDKVADVGKGAFTKLYPQQPCAQGGAQVYFQTSPGREQIDWSFV